MDGDVLLVQETRNASQELLHNTMAPGGHKLIVNKHKGHDASIVVHTMAVTRCQAASNTSGHSSASGPTAETLHMGPMVKGTQTGMDRLTTA